MLRVSICSPNLGEMIFWSPVTQQTMFVCVCVLIDASSTFHHTYSSLRELLNHALNHGSVLSASGSSKIFLTSTEDCL